MMQYDYSTRQITRDYVLVKEDEKCKFSGLPAKVGNDRCMKCRYFSSKIYSWEYGSAIDGDSTYVLCRCKKQKDSEGCQDALSYLYRRFEDRALCALAG